MALTIGSQVGSHKVTAMLGKGGMGVVFRAHDTKLQRDVALKLLPDHFADDPDRLARFRREALVLASLNHPNIAQIYGLEDSTGQLCIVMELVEGETLAQKLERGAIPVREALGIARQIAEALEAAHEKGIMHRDLKPANIKVTVEGQVKVLDFGLAKIFEEPSAQMLSESPTLTGGTLSGEILGTAAYMSPEQARGQQAQRTSDVWSFGCVLYEMLTGQKAFNGDTVTDILGSVLKLEPDWNALPKQTPDGIRKLLHRCLHKERKRRLHDIADVRIEIEETTFEGETLTTPKRSSPRLAWIVAAAAVVATIAIAFTVYLRRAPDEPPEQRVEINTPPTTRYDLASFALAPDGRKLVFTVPGDHLRLWLRSLDSVQASPIAETEGAELPFWSPDSQAIGFFAGSFLKRIDLTGGVAQTLSDAPPGGGLGGSWSPKGVIVFNGAPGNPLYRLSDNGQNRAEATVLDLSRQVTQTRPHFLPDGVHFLFLALGNPDSSGIYAGSTASNEIRRLFDANAPAVFMPPDHLLYIRQGTLLAHRFDPQKLELTGEPTPIAQQVASVSAAAGVIAYRNAPAGASRPGQLSWFDRSGKIMEDLPPGYALSPELSADGGRLAFYRGSGGGNYDIWVLDLATGRLNRVTAETGVKGFPEWSPDGSRVAFTTNSGHELHVKLASGVGTEETLFKSPGVMSPSDWSADGRHILIQSGLVFQRDILALPVSSEGKPAGQPIPIATSARFDERDAKFSPDGHWIAYQSNETGRFEIYLVPFPSLDTKLTVTSAGGREVRWRRDGKELFYLSLDGKMMSVPVTPSANSKTLNIGAASALFSTNHLALEPGPDINGQSYVVSPDGKRFLLYSTMEEVFNSPITLILHWKPPAK